MSEAELETIRRELASTNGLTRLPATALLEEVRRLRKICADALPFAETALRAGLDFEPSVQDEIIAGHATIISLRSALIPERS